MFQRKRLFVLYQELIFGYIIKQ